MAIHTHFVDDTQHSRNAILPQSSLIVWTLEITDVQASNSRLSWQYYRNHQVTF